MINYKKVDLITTIIFLLFGVYLIIAFTIGIRSEPVSGNATSWGDIFDMSDTFDLAPPTPGPDAKLTWDQFKQIEEENNRVQQLRDMEDRSTGNGTGGSLALTYSIESCDTCSTFGMGYFNAAKTTRYYLALSDYSLREDTTFHFRHGRNYLHYPTWDSIHTKKDGGWVRFGRMITKEVPFRFQYSDFENRLSNRKGSVLVPISKKAYGVFQVLIPLLTWFCLITLLYIIIGLPVKILLRIAQGKAFIRKNVRQLNIVGWTILIALVFSTLVMDILHLVYRKYMTSDLHFDYFAPITDNKTSILAAIAFFIVAKAFKKGLTLQHEQDLTI